MPKKIGFISLGCAKNRVNSEQMMQLLSEAGYTVSGDLPGCDAVVINTCGFIEEAKTEAIETIFEMTELKAKDSIGALIVAGCLPQRYKDDIIEELTEIDALIGTGSFDEITEVVESVIKKGGNEKKQKRISKYGDIDAPVSEAGRIITTSPVWTYLKIAEGCDNRCAYCCIPSIRGRYRSRRIENIAEEAASLAKAGFKELVLVAQDTTAYGTDIYGKRSLLPLLRELEKIENLKWIRLLYMYPDGFDDALIDEISKSDRIVKYLDIPIQHINNGILQRMNRRGSSGDIKCLISKLRERIPNVVLRTSVITGLPGEGEREFKELCDFLRETKIERAGVFAYSPEEGTPAANMEHPNGETAEHRAEILREIQAGIMTEFNMSRVGTICEVLIEGVVDDSDYDNLAGADIYARSYAEAPEIDEYIRVSGFKEEHNVTYPFGKITISGTESGELTGKILI